MHFVNVRNRLDDAEIQRVLSYSLFQPASQASIERVVARIRGDKNLKLWAMIEGEQVLGVVHYYCTDVTYIANISVDEDFRNQGIGSAMIAKLHENYNLPLIAETDDDAVDFYRKCGFIVERAADKNGTERFKCTLC